jgi:hypothetical protein
MSPLDHEDVLYPNGVDPDGHLAWQPVRLDEMAARLDDPAPAGDPTDGEEEETYRRLRRGLEADDLAEAGWAILAPPGYDRVLDELAPLLERRAQEARAAYRPPIEVGPGEEAEGLLRRLGVGPGLADPRELPYYLLILGGPDEISFDTQQVIANARAVGRLSLERLDDYRTYARNLVEAEDRPRRGRPEAAFFAAVNGEDRATRRTRDQLVTPLADALEEAHPAWRVRRLAGEAATKPQLVSLLTDEAPSLLFTATHGLAPRTGSAHQRERQGAPIASEWGGHGTPCPPECYLTGDELPAELGLDGGVAFLFACFGAGTPSHDAFWFHDGEGAEPRRTADPPFVARLVQGLLSRRGGPSAVIGHVDRAWTCSFFWHRAGQINGYVDTLSELVAGGRVGWALEWLLEVFRDQGGRHFALDERRRAGYAVDQKQLRRYRLAAHDARNFVICGDPAARLPIG